MGQVWTEWTWFCVWASPALAESRLLPASRMAADHRKALLARRRDAVRADPPDPSQAQRQASRRTAGIALEGNRPQGRIEVLVGPRGQPMVTAPSLMATW